MNLHVGSKIRLTSMITVIMGLGDGHMKGVPMGISEFPGTIGVIACLESDGNFTIGFPGTELNPVYIGKHVRPDQFEPVE